MKDFLRQVLWLSVCIVPVPAGAFAVHTPDAMLVGMLSFSVLATVVPFLYFSFQRRGFGVELGKQRCAVHLVLALAFLLLYWTGVWFMLGQEEMLWTMAGPIVGTGAAVISMVLFLMVLLCAVYEGTALYQAMKAKHPVAAPWLALVFLTGVIPGTLLCVMLFLSFTGLDHGMMFVFYVSTGLTWILFLKIALAMMGIPLYLYFVETGSRWKRSLQVIFTAFFWLICLYIPLIISLRLPIFGAWRIYADPSYLAICPFLSDFWLMAAAYFGGKKVTEWIFARGN